MSLFITVVFSVKINTDKQMLKSSDMGNGLVPGDAVIQYRRKSDGIQIA